MSKTICRACGTFDEVVVDFSTATHWWGRCVTCYKMIVGRVQEARGTIWKCGLGDQVVAAAGEIEEDYRLIPGHMTDTLFCQNCGVESMLMDDVSKPTDGWGWWGVGCLKEPMCGPCLEWHNDEWRVK